MAVQLGDSYDVRGPNDWFFLQSNIEETQWKTCEIKFTFKLINGRDEKKSWSHSINHTFSINEDGTRSVWAARLGVTRRQLLNPAKGWTNQLGKVKVECDIVVSLPA